MKNKKKFIIISFVVLLCVALVVTISAVSGRVKEIDIIFQSLDEPLLEGKYSTFLNENQDALKTESDYEKKVDASAFTLGSGVNLTYHEQDQLQAYPLKEQDQVEISFNVDESGLYQIELSYYLLTDAYVSNEISVSVNGEIPYEEARQISLEETWIDVGEITSDRYGNDNLPEQQKVQTLNTFLLRDSARLFDEGLYFRLLKGNNKIIITSVQGNLDIVSLNLKKYNKKKTYAEYYHQEAIKETTLLTYEAEDYISKNSSSIQAGTSTDAGVTPFSVNRNKLNVIGSGNYNEAGDRVNYRIEVPESGYYYLSMKVLQTEKNTTTYRTLYINGEVPFEEAYYIPFRYHSTWQNVTIGGTDGKPFALYLTKGTNEIGLEVSVSKMRIINEKLYKISSEMNQLGLEVTRITGNSSDTEIDWEMDEYFTDIHETFDRWINELKQMIDYLKNANGYEGSSYSVSDISTALKNIQTIAKNVNKLPSRLTLLSSGSSCASQFLSGQISTIITSSLTIDKFYIHSEKTKLPKAKTSGFKNAWIQTRRLFNSFFDQNYTASSNSDAVKVWTARSRQYVNVLQKMVDEDFTKETGIKVDIELLSDESKILLANAANKQPDVVTGVSTWIPNEYGMRGAIYDLRNFDDYAKAIEGFYDEQLIPLIYDDQLFGIPETENFYVLFYRKDILDKLSLTVPSTWDDVIDLLPVLERYGMQFYIPLSSSSSSKSFDMTAPFIWQNEGTLYNLDTLTSGIDNENTIQALSFMTNLYREYSLPYQISNFFNYFRYGDMPIGIADYGTYLQLLNAAPEISGLWGISVVPGIEKNGQINRYMSGAQQATMIFKDSNKRDDAWEFVKWWTKKETQLEYSQKMINTYGKKYLWNTANMDAFAELPWDVEDKKVILEQWSYLKEVAKIPGSYIVEREISNIYNSVVFNDTNLRSTVSDSVIKMNKEIKRKMIEFGYMDEMGNILKTYNYPSAETIQKWRENA